jgi:putative aminopeptidase FrvX
MANLPGIDHQYLIGFLVKLLDIASPTGFAEPAISFVEKELSQFSQLQLTRTRKGALIAKWEVDSDLPPVADEFMKCGAARTFKFEP